MTVVGSVHLLVFGFDSQGSLPDAVVDHLQRLCTHAAVRILDVIVASRDERGLFRLEHDASSLELSTEQPESALWTLFDVTGGSTTIGRVEIRSSGEIGLDLEAIESLPYHIEPGTSALLLLVENCFVMELRESIVGAGGFPILAGYLEPETMLILGPTLAGAVEARTASDARASARGASMLDALTRPAGDVNVAAEVARALTAVGIIDPTDVSRALDLLAREGFIATLTEPSGEPAADREAEP